MGRTEEKGPKGRVREQSKSKEGRNLPGFGRVFNSLSSGVGQGSHALLVDFEGCATPWPGPGCRSASAITLGLRGGIYRPWVRGMGQRDNHRHPASSRRPNRCESAFLVAMAVPRDTITSRVQDTFTSTITHDSLFPPPGASRPYLASTPHLRSGRLSPFGFTSARLLAGWAPRTESATLANPSSSSSSFRLSARFELPGDPS